MDLYKRLKFNPPFIVTHYEKLIYEYNNEIKELDINKFKHKMFTNQNINDRYNDFRELVINKIHISGYFPIYRMSDGEFMFCLNFLENPSISFSKKVKKILGNIKRLLFPLKMYDRKMKKNYFEMIKNIFSQRSIIVAHGEFYSSKEKALLKTKMIEYLNFLSQEGMIALDFSEYENQHPYSQLIKPMCDWFDKNKININNNNYIPFYFVYIFLNELLDSNILVGKNLLIITNFSKEKENSIRANLERNNLNIIDFYNISASKSFFERLDFEKIRKIKYDIILVAAGIGSINILKQLNILKTVCIDAGIIIECLANPDIRKTRIFLKSNN